MGLHVNNSNLNERRESKETFPDYGTIHSRNEIFNRISLKNCSFNVAINLIEVIVQFMCLPHNRKSISVTKYFALSTLELKLPLL
jgi:hypothetical protein